MGGFSERPGAADSRVTSEADLRRVLGRLSERAEAFAAMPPGDKARLLRDVGRRVHELAHRFAQQGVEHKGIDVSSELYGEELLASAVTTLHYTRLLERSLLEIERYGLPQLPDGAVRDDPDGSVVRLVPLEPLDRLRFLTMTGDVFVDVPPSRLSEARAGFYRGLGHHGEVGLVLGAGNIPSIPPMDALHELFVKGRVCVLKMSPVNAYLGPLLEIAFAPLIERGFLAIVYGGGEVGAFLCDSPEIAAIHVTGSNETHDKIVWGTGEARESAKLRNEPRLRKQVTSELGNVTPVIIPPARYQEQELEHLARSIAGMVTHNASFNCISAKMLVLPEGELRSEILARVERVLVETPLRRAYYPGAEQRHAALIRMAKAETLGEPLEGQLPWTLLGGLTSTKDSPLFRTEPFCSVLSEVTVPGESTVEFLENATEFVNEKLWGTLSAMLIAPSALLQDPEERDALERSISGLRYGVVSINAWSGLSFGLGELPWGAWPGSPLCDVQSGIGFSHNALMLEAVRKVVFRAPLVPLFPSFWYGGHKSLRAFAQAYLDFEAEPGVMRFLRLANAARKG